jgi:large subunit ribosomal protein L10
LLTILERKTNNMNKEQKQEVIETLKNKFSQYSNFYITDTENLSVAQVTNLRRHCFDKHVEMKVAKNTLIKKALESLDEEKYSGVYDSLQKVTALMFSESPKDPAVIISSFRREQNGEKPTLKAAFINGDIFVGDNQLINLTRIKTKNELIGEVIGLLMSPIQRVIGALQNKPGTTEVAPKEKAEVKKEVAPETKAETTSQTKTVETPKAQKAKETSETKSETLQEVKTEAGIKTKENDGSAEKRTETESGAKAEETPKAQKEEEGSDKKAPEPGA